MLQNKMQVETVNFRLYFKVIIREKHSILSDDDFAIKSKIYSFNPHLVLKHILHSQDVFFRNLLFTLLKGAIKDIITQVRLVIFVIQRAQIFSRLLNIFN